MQLCRQHMGSDIHFDGLTGCMHFNTPYYFLYTNIIFFFPNKENNKRTCQSVRNGVPGRDYGHTQLLQSLIFYNISAIVYVVCTAIVLYWQIRIAVVFDALTGCTYFNTPYYFLKNIIFSSPKRKTIKEPVNLSETVFRYRDSGHTQAIQRLICQIQRNVSVMLALGT